MAVLLFLAILAISFIVVRVGALALELTGLEWEKAKFQALSAFTNSGFTTKESEQVVSHPARRRVISLLIVTGNAGRITLVGAFIGTFIEQGTISPLISIGYLLAGTVVIIWFFHLGPIATYSRGWVQSWLSKKYGMRHLEARDLLSLDDGFELKSVLLDKRSEVANKELRDLQLKQNQVQVLSIEREQQRIPAPRGDVRLFAGDILAVYGPSVVLDRLFSEDRDRAINVVEEEEAHAAT